MGKLFAAWLFVLICLSCGAAGAQGLHEREIGTKVTGAFTLGSKTFYVPEGDWTLVAKHQWNSLVASYRVGSPMAGVLLLEIRDSRLSRGVLVQTNLQVNMGTNWSNDPCRTDDSLQYQKQLGPSYQNQFCVEVRHLVNFLSGGTGWVEPAYRWALENKIAVPYTVLRVFLARVDDKDDDLISYYFNPEVDGFAPAVIPQRAANEWHRERIKADPARLAYVQNLAQWGEAIAATVLAGISRRGDLHAAILRAPYPLQEYRSRPN